MAHPDQELFLNSTSSKKPTETPPPLRINKQHSGGAPAGSEEPPQQWAQYRVPPPSSAAYGAPLSPPPAGPLPLPYPDERTRRQHMAGSGGDIRVPGGPAMPQESSEDAYFAGPPRLRKSSISSNASSAASGAGSSASNGRRPRYDPNDPQRPSAPGYGTLPVSPTTGRLADRRGAALKNIIPPDSPGGPEPPHKSDDDEGLFAVMPTRERKQSVAAPSDDSFQQFYPPPLGALPPIAPPQAKLHIPDPEGLNRLSSTASTHTTRASRGSPPPPETPIVGEQLSSLPQLPTLGGIEARYAASGISGTGTLNEMQAPSAAAAARRAQYIAPQPRRGELSVQPPRLQTLQAPSQPIAEGRGWSPTEAPGSAPHGPPIAFQGNEEVDSAAPAAPAQQQPSYPRPPQPSQSPNLEADMARVNLHDEPPPAYSPPTAGSTHSQYPNEKGRFANSSSPAQSAASVGSQGRLPSEAGLRQHPAFANDPHQPTSTQTPQPGPVKQGGVSGATVGLAPLNTGGFSSQTPQPVTAGPSVSIASPPPLPEGWIAHLDSNSGLYYYIHLATQSTQWEFPKGPTPLDLPPTSPIGNFVNPLASPVGSTFKMPLNSPGFPMHQMASYDKMSMMSMNSIASPTTTGGFSGPPPTAGIDLYKINPSNAVYFGPYLRYTNMDLERGLWLGSIMLITEVNTQPPTIHIHQSLDLSPNPRQLKAHPIHSHQRWIFYRYDIDLIMEEQGSAKWTYAITSHLGCTRYEFLVAGRHETSWRFVAHSGNDFAPNVNANERNRQGGVAHMWKDVLVKHQECGGFHTQVGLGGQICADRLWKDVPALKQWTEISGKENRRTVPWTAKMDEDVTHAYFHYYTSHFDQPAVKEAFAQIPHVSCLDDHDIFDGYGSYPQPMQESNVFKGIGRIGIDMFLLFQHHTTHEILRNVSTDIDLFTITGRGWHFLKYFGPAVVLCGPDTRSERSQAQVMAGPTYQGLFPKIAMLPPSVQHCIWLMPVPIVYPRLESVEQVAHTVATGKKMVTGGFNMLGKVAGGVAGVVGAKGVVNQGFDGVKKAIGKSGLMQGVLSPFGEIDMLDELRDQWTHESKDLERTYIIRTLQGISHTKSLRMTFLSGSVNACGAGLVHDPSKPSDHKTMYQLITSAIVNAPSPNYVMKLLHNNKQLYVPMNGHRSTNNAQSDTKEDMMEIFAADVTGQPRELRRLMNRRNYLACVIYDPEAVQGAFGVPQTPGAPPTGKLSLAADFMVQSEGGFGQPLKYGPVIIPSLEYGR